MLLVIIEFSVTIVVIEFYLQLLLSIRLAISVSLFNYHFV